MATVKEIIDALDDALDYEETGSVAKARRVITMAKRLMVRRPQSAAHSSSSVSYDVAQLQQMIADARTWINANPVGGAASSVKYLSVNPCYRG